MTCLRSIPQTRLRKKRDVLGTRVIQGGKTLNAHFFGAAQKTAAETVGGALFNFSRQCGNGKRHMYPLFGQIKTNRGAFRGSPLKLTAGTNARELLRRFVEALDDFVGEVNLGARPDSFLKNQVVLLALGEILNDAVGA